MLAPGTRLGAYEIAGLLGQGGMGEVYRARDTRLLREVAIKVLPASRADDATALSRFESEARAASVINDPHIVAVHDVGESEGVHFIVMELVEGRTLRDRLSEGPIPLPDVLELSAQIAAGLAAAHDRDVVHRDLKPENVLIDEQGRVKISDFGLAKLKQPLFAAPEAVTLDDRAGGAASLTDPKVLLGTVSYMSPEQAAGRSVDHRSDQFSFGVMLHEMLTGHRPFARATPAETLAAIIRDEPEPVTVGDPRLDGPLRWILARCVAKEPAERYDSTGDLARDVSHLRSETTSATSTRTKIVLGRHGRITRRSFTLAAGAGAAGIAALGAGLWLRRHMRSEAKYERLTFDRGTIWNGRFTPNGGAIIYSAAWEGQPFRLFRKEPHNPVSLPVNVGEAAAILAISSQSEMAVLVHPRVVLPGRLVGTLARVPIIGGAPRLVLDDVADADWSPDGTELALIRGEGGRCILEFPVGKRLFASTGWLSEPRISADGTRVAVFEHPLAIHDMGRVWLIGTDGTRESLGGVWTSSQGMAWSPSGTELWVAASHGDGPNALHTVDLAGQTRLIERAPGTLTLLDTSSEGTALVTRQSRHLEIVVYTPDGRRHDLTVLDSSVLADLSDDGSTVLSTEFGEGGGRSHSVYLRRDLEDSPLRLGEGMAVAVSPDGMRALAVLPGTGPELVAYPTGPGEPIPIRADGVQYTHAASFFPDGRHIIVAGVAHDGSGPFLYVHDLHTGAAHRLSTAPVFLGHMQGFPVSPDGRWAAALSPDRVLTLHSTADGRRRPLGAAPEGAFPVRWVDEGRALVVARLGEVPASAQRLDLETGAITTIREIPLSDPTGVHGFPSLRVSADTGTWAVTRAQVLSELYSLTNLL